MRAAWDGKAGNFNRVPKQSELNLDPNAAYVYLTSNETIQGVQFPGEPQVGDVPLVCDSSSDFLCRPVPVDRYGILFACAQKKRGSRRRNHRHHSRRPDPEIAQRPALDAQLPRHVGEQVAAEHSAHVRHLHGQAGDRLAASRHWRAGQDGRAQPAANHSSCTTRSRHPAASTRPTPNRRAARS